jgi:4-diphosphocytidyl-2-C-methyl-D-erythritol kinase
MTMPATDADRRLAPVIRLAPAKVNLTLAVLGTRPDGFHDLHSVMVPLDLADRLSVSVLPPGSPDSLHVEGFDPGPPKGNLVLRAIGVARRHAAAATGRPGALAPLAARLDKRIPVAAGLAGGSSDAAATVDAALEAWGVAADVEPEARRRIAAELGSDVPFFLADGPALVEGRGERVTPLGWLRDAGDGEAAADRPGLLVVTPDVAISTPAAFAAFDAGARAAGGAARQASTHLADELRTGLRVVDLLARAGVLAAGNDLALAAAVVEPGLVAFKRSLLRLLGRPVGLSGSGPTHWALYPSLDEATTAAGQVRDAFADGRIPTPGGRAPFVAAARIVPPRHDPRRQA